MSLGFLLGLLALPAIALLGLLRWWWGRRAARSLAAGGYGQASTMGTVARRRLGMRHLLLWCGLALAAAALAAPRWGAVEEERTVRGCDVLVAMDCSRSMLATDLYPDRMQVARRKALDLLTLAPELRLAVLPFAAKPVLRCPLTGDRAALAEMLDDCSPDLFPAEANLQGTAIGLAVQDGVRLLQRQVERGQAIIVFSDGIDEDTKAVQAAGEAAKAAGIPVYGLFLGDAERTATVTIDGRPVTVTATRDTLDTLAEATLGISVNAQTDDSDLRAIVDHLLATVQQDDWAERRRIVASERYRWAVLPGLLLFALGCLIPTRRRRP